MFFVGVVKTFVYLYFLSTSCTNVLDLFVRAHDFICHVNWEKCSVTLWHVTPTLLFNLIFL